MNYSVVGVKNPYWDLNKSKSSPDEWRAQVALSQYFPTWYASPIVYLFLKNEYVVILVFAASHADAEIDNWPLMAFIGPVLTILAIYLVFVLKVGPAFMRKREAYKLTYVMLAYNGVQVAISIYMVWRFFFDLLEMGLVPKKCYMTSYSSRHEILFGTYIYLSAKITELLDTVFFVLRKKDSQITFLHLYHHSVMVIGTWALLKYWPSHTLIFIGFLNSLVHVFMYTYYGLAALGPSIAKYLTWKKYMTKFQLIQFVSIIIQYVATVRISECPPARGVAVFVSCNTGFLLLLFLNFYRQRYTKRRSEQISRDFNVIQKCNNEKNTLNVSAMPNDISVSDGTETLSVKSMSNGETISNCTSMVNSTSISHTLNSVYSTNAANVKKIL